MIKRRPSGRFFCGYREPPASGHFQLIVRAVSPADIAIRHRKSVSAGYSLDLVDLYRFFIKRRDPSYPAKNQSQFQTGKPRLTNARRFFRQY